MSRTIRSAADVSRASGRMAGAAATALADAPPAAAPPPDGYTERLVKYIPAEVVAVFLSLQTVVLSTDPTKVSQPGLMWLLFGLLLLATPLYLRRVAKVDKAPQIAISTVAFLVWVFSLGGPFAFTSWYQPVYGALLLPLFTFAIPILEP